MLRGNKILAVITTYNRIDLVKRLLASLNRISSPRFDVLIVDDSSNEDCQSVAAGGQYDFLIDYIKNDRQSGPAFSLNRSIDYAIEKKYDYLWLLNDDSVVTECTLELLFLAIIGSENLAAVGSAIYDIDHPDNLISAGYFFDFESLMPKINLSQRLVDYISICSDLIRVDVLRQTGLRFDPAYFMRSYDIDFYLPLKKWGYRIAVVKQAPVYHPNFANDPFDKQYYNLRNNCYFCLKFDALKFKQEKVIKSWLADCRKLYRQEYALEAAAFYSAIADFFRLKMGPVDFYSRSGFRRLNDLGRQKIIFPYFGQTRELAMIDDWLRRHAPNCHLTMLFAAGQPLVKLLPNQNNIILPKQFFYRLFIYSSLIGQFDYIIIAGGIRNLFHPLLAGQKIKMEKNSGQMYAAKISWLDYYFFDFKIYFLALAISIGKHFTRAWRRHLLKKFNF